MKVDLAVLTAAGHPPMRTASLVAAFNRVIGGDVFAVEFARIKRHKHIRAYCMRCVEGEAEVRRCTTFWCPFWPYRMGRNPHNPQRGKNPFAKENGTDRGQSVPRHSLNINLPGKGQKVMSMNEQ